MTHHQDSKKQFNSVGEKQIAIRLTNEVIDKIDKERKRIELNTGMFMSRANFARMIINKYFDYAE